MRFSDSLFQAFTIGVINEQLMVYNILLPCFDFSHPPYCLVPIKISKKITLSSSLGEAKKSLWNSTSCYGSFFRKPPMYHLFHLAFSLSLAAITIPTNPSCLYLNSLLFQSYTFSWLDRVRPIDTQPIESFVYYCYYLLLHLSPRH